MIVNAAGENRLNQAKAAAKKLISTVESNSAVDAIYKIVDFAGNGHSQTIDDATAGEVVDGKVNVVRISEWYDSKEVADGEATGRINSITVREDIYANDTFTYTNAKGESVTKTGFYYNHRATNYEAVFRQVNTIDNYRNNTMKVIVFLTDGDPTCAWTKIESDDTSDGKGYIDGYWNSEGYGTTNETTNNIKKCLAAAKDEIGALKADRFYMVGIGEAKRLSTVNNYATQVPYKKVINTNSSSLESEFEKIGTTLNELFYKNITITDTLSHEDGKLMVKITDPNTIGITVKNGSKVVAQSAAGVKTVTIPETPRNSQAELTASYDEATDQLKLDFPDSYKLEPNYTYILSAVIEPTEKAYREYRAASESYTDTPDSGTGTHATNNENGFFSNDSAVVNYAYGDQTGLHVNYKYPVVRLTPGNLVVTKEITGLTEDQIKALDLKFDVTITYPDDESVDSTETVSRQLTLSDMTPKDGVYSYTFTGLSPNTEYTVTESGGAVDGYTMTTKVNGTAANEEKSATGTVGKGATVTVAYENDYTVAVTNVTVEKQVTGNMGDSDKPFTFKASLKDASMVGLEFVQYSKNESGELSKGTKMTIGEADLNADGLFEFTLKDDEYITFSKVPMKGTLIISEDRGVYTLTDVIVTNIPEGYEDNLMKTQNGMELFVTGEHKITFNNHYSVSVDTGFSFDSYPFILMLSTAIVAAFVLLMGKLRYRREF